MGTPEAGAAPSAADRDPTDRDATDRDAGSLVDAIVAAVTGVDNVVGLYAGTLGSAATLLPGRRVAGVRIDGDTVEVHIVVGPHAPVRETATDVRDAVVAVRPGPVHIVVEDIAYEDIAYEPHEHTTTTDQQENQ